MAKSVIRTSKGKRDPHSWGYSTKTHKNVRRALIANDTKEDK